MSIVQLPLKDPFIKTYQFHAFPISVAANHPDFMNWFCSNYNQITFPKSKFKEVLNPTNFYSFWDYFILCPIIERFYIEKELVLTKQEVTEFIIDSINRELYVMSFVDEYYIPNRNSYKRNHFPHDILVHSYDLSERKFITSGFVESRQYSNNTPVSFEQLNLAMNITNDNEYYSEFSNWSNKINLLRVRYDWSYNFDLNAFKQSISDYLLSFNSSLRFSMLRNVDDDNAYGIEVYKYLRHYIDSFDEKYIDIRILHLIWEHKKNMIIKLNFVSTHYHEINNVIIEKFYWIEKHTLMLRNLAMKYNLTQDRKILENMSEHITVLADEEALIFLYLLDNI